MPAPLPPDEETRLQTLARYDVLDTPPDAALDRLTALAARLFDVPIALVSFVDRDRQWFKSHHGLEMCEIHRDQSFCAHAILPGIDGPMVVTDATLDPRFADNPLVTGAPGIRFYAGAPLRMRNGTALGSFCIIDTKPREISSADRATLLDLATMAVDTLSIYRHEITERVQAQRQLENSHKLLKAIIDGTDNHIFIKDRESRYLLINPAGAAMLGTTPEEATGKGDEAFFLPESVRGNRASDLRVMETGEMQTYESSDIINGIERVFLSTKSPYRDAAGNLLGIIGISREITEQRRVAEALRAAKEEAEKANAAKSEFLSRMSHELRTPLNAILGFGQLLEISDLGNRPAEGVSHILKAGRHLLGLIDEVLSISRIEAGAMNLSMEPVRLAEITAECINLVSRAAADRRVTCEDRCTPTGGVDGGAHVQADRQRLRQVLLNLLSNAVKYNRQGGRVILDCHALDPGEDGQRRLRVEVTDTGAGLTAEQIGRLFTPFERLGAERSTTEGTGLGLALSKGLVEAMGGRIGVDSVSGEGSTFWLELEQARHPLETMDGGAGAGKGSAAEDDALGTVLYVEDNASNLRLVEMVLEQTPGIRLLSAQQGLLGLEIARARRPDLILLDLHLPDIAGWEVLTMLQDDPATRNIPTVIISADATPGRIERLRAAGARDYLTKPIDVPKLMEVLRQYLRPEVRPEKTAAGPLELANAL